MPVSAICAGFEGSLVIPSRQRRVALDGIKRLLDVAEELNAGGLIIAPDYGTPALPDLRPAVDPAALHHELLVAGLRELGEHLHGMRTALYLEPLNRYESRALRRTAPAVALCKEVGCPTLWCCMTVSYGHRGGRPIAALREAGPYLGYVHLADSNRQLPGHGHTDFAALMSALQAMTYDAAAHAQHFREMLGRGRGQLEHAAGVQHGVHEDPVQPHIAHPAFIYGGLSHMLASATADRTWRLFT